MGNDTIGTTLIERRPPPVDYPPALAVRPVTGGQISHPLLGSRPVDKIAIVSAVCGIVPVIPVISQVAGVVLGILAICRIRRARREGIVLGGMGWAIAGIVSSVLFLIACVVVLVILGGVFWVFAHAANTLDQIAVAPQ